MTATQVDARAQIGESIAAIVHDGFDRFYGEFHRITREARRWFDACEWMRVQDLHHQRIDLYVRHVTVTLGRLRPLTREYPEDVDVWRSAHRAYAGLIRDRTDLEVAETFFNAISRKIFRTVGVNREVEFVQSEFDTATVAPDPRHVRRQIRHTVAGATLDMFVDLLRQPRPAIGWADIQRDAAWLAARFEAHCRGLGIAPVLDGIDVLGPLFFRVREG